MCNVFLLNVHAHSTQILSLDLLQFYLLLFIYPQIFQPYAKHWLTVLSQFIISAEDADGMGGGEMGLNYFLVDIIATMLSWSGTAIIEVSIYTYMWHWEMLFSCAIYFYDGKEQKNPLRKTCVNSNFLYYS